MLNTIKRKSLIFLSDFVNFKVGHPPPYITFSICLSFCLSIDCAPYLRNCISSLVHLCKMMISRGIFFNFFKILTFQVFRWGGVKWQKMSHKQQFHSITFNISELQIILSRFLVCRCKIMIFLLVHFYSFFNKQLFFKFINNCQTEILSYPSSHVCDFSHSVGYYESFKLIMSFQMGVFRHAQTYSKCLRILDDQYLKKDLSYCLEVFVCNLVFMETSN